MTGVIDGRSYDDIRTSLIAHMTYIRRDSDAGNHAGRRPQPPAAAEGKYFHNTNECLTELMRLGFVERATLPGSRKALDSYRGSVFSATADGRAWVEEVTDNVASAYDMLAARLWRIHPQFAGYVRMLQRGKVVIPTARWQEVHPDIVDDNPRVRKAARAAYVDFVLERTAGAIAAGVTGWEATRDEVQEAVVGYLHRLEARANARGREAFPKNRDFLAACEEALVSFALARLGVTADFVTIEVLRRWLRTLNLAGFSYHVPGPPALTIWRTAEVDDAGVDLRIMRPTLREVAPLVVRELPVVFGQATARSGGSFVSIHVVRAGVCSRLQVSEAVFERVLRDLVAGERAADGFDVQLDPASFGALPPTERPFLVPTRGQMRAFYVMTLIQHPERKSL
jgi:hypothetical protein